MRFLKHQKYQIYTIYTKLTPNDAENRAELKQSHILQNQGAVAK